jgi:hypothetical protein
MLAKSHDLYNKAGYLIISYYNSMQLDLFQLLKLISRTEEGFFFFFLFFVFLSFDFRVILFLYAKLMQWKEKNRFCTLKASFVHSQTRNLPYLF